VRVAITGATGTIGRALTQALGRRSDQVVALSRDERRARQVLGDGVEVRAWAQPPREPPPRDALAGADAVVNLLGEPLSQRWSDDVKREIRDSRERATCQLVEALGALPEGERPGTLISQSATGYYGPSDDRPLDEESPAGSDFLAGVVLGWEREALAAPSRTRTVVTRTGVVLSPAGGALGKMLPFFRLGVGGPVAGGRQYVSWIHLDDVVGAIVHCLDGRLDGAVNLTAPSPVTNGEFSKALGRALHRPAVLPVPAVALKLMYGEMATIVITGQRVLPRKLQQDDYEFAHPGIEEALRDVLGRS
jgi:uncharacterized protein (TIGR01777 family)